MNRVIKSSRFVLFYYIYFLFMAWFLRDIDIHVLFKDLICSFVPIIFYFVLSRDKISDIFLTKKLSIKKYLLLFLFAFTIQPIFMFISAISSLFSRNLVQDLTPFLYSNSPLIVFIHLALVPALVEETIFRGIIFSGHKNISHKKLFLINGLIFGAYHSNFQQFFYAAAAGIVFCALVYYTQSIFSSMLVHFIVNFTQIASMYLVKPNPKLLEDLPQQTLIQLQNVALISLILPLSICIPLSLWLFEKITRKDISPENKDLQSKHNKDLENKNPETKNNQKPNNNLSETPEIKKLNFKNIFTPSLITFFIVAFFIMCLTYTYLKI